MRPNCFRIKNFIRHTDKICFDLACGFTVDSINSFISRIGDFFCIFGKLDLWCKSRASGIFYCSKLVYTAESRVILAGDQVGSDTPGIDFGILGLKAVDQVLIQITGSRDRCIVKSGSSKHFVGFLGKIRKVTTVNTDSVVGKFHTFLSHLFKDADCIWDTRFEDIIGVDQKRTGIWIHSGIGLKCSVFIRETHDPAVCVCAKYGNVEHLACKYIGGAGTSADHSGACTINTGIRSLCTAKTKFHDSISSRCVADTGCLGSNKTLMIDDVQDRSFNKLCFHDRCNDLDKWFSWEYDSSFRDCINITGKMKVA